MSIEQLPPEVAPPATLEDRSVSRLQQSGLLAAPRRGRGRWQSVAAASLLFVAGVATGALLDTPRGVDVTAPSTPRFLLLLHGATTTGSDDEQQAVAAYRAWALRLREAGRAVSGERLAPESMVVPGGAPPADAVQGYFVISAASLADAVAIAQSAPHVARGGRIVVRPID